MQNLVRNPNLTTSLSNCNTCSLLELFDECSEYWSKTVTCPLIDNLLMVKTGRVCDPFLLDVTAKLEQTFSDGVLQKLSALHFNPELVIFTQNRYFVPKYDSSPLFAFEC